MNDTAERTTEDWIEAILTEHGEEFRAHYMKLKNDPINLAEHWDDQVLGPLYVDRNLKKIDMADFTVLFASMDYRRIGFDEVGPWHVSTVWLGVSGIRGYVFETMVFQNELSRSKEWEHNGIKFPAYTYHESLEDRRYRTEQDAREGHAELVRQAEAMLMVNDAIDPRAGL